MSDLLLCAILTFKSNNDLFSSKNDCYFLKCTFASMYYIVELFFHLPGDLLLRASPQRSNFSCARGSYYFVLS